MCLRNSLNVASLGSDPCALVDDALETVFAGAFGVGVCCALAQRLATARPAVINTTVLRFMVPFSKRVQNLTCGLGLHLRLSGDGIAASKSECLLRNLQAGSCLLALVFALVYHANHLSYQLWIVAVLRCNCIREPVVFNVVCLSLIHISEPTRRTPISY